MTIKDAPKKTRDQDFGERGKRKGSKSDDGMALNEMGNSLSSSKEPHKMMNDS